MKKIKIGDSTYDLLESVVDINDKRFIFFKAYLLKSLEGIDRPLLKATMDKVIEFFNQNRYMQAFGEMQNYQRAIEYEDYNDDALSKCFALICLEEGEDQLNVDDNFLSEKLKRLHANGLTRGFVEEAVQNFSRESPASLGNYSLMLEEVILNLNATSLKELESLQNESKKKKG
jgi:hypothetical protein